MAGSNVEILVHIKAPSRAVDDKRYAAIAQGVLEFEPACVTRLLGSDGDIVSIDSVDTVSSIPLNNEVDLQDPASLKPWTTSRMQMEIAVMRCVTPTKLSVLRRQYSVSKNCRSSRIRYVQRKADNPPYRSPLRRKASTKTPPSLVDTISHTNTSASSDMNQILVPNTEHPTRIQAWSDVTDALAETMVVVESQPIASSNVTQPPLFSKSGSAPGMIGLRRDKDASDLRSHRCVSKNEMPHRMTETCSGTSDMAYKHRANKSCSSPISENSPSNYNSTSITSLHVRSTPIRLSSSSIAPRLGSISTMTERDISTATPSSRSPSLIRINSNSPSSHDPQVGVPPIDLITPESSEVDAARRSSQPLPAVNAAITSSAPTCFSDRFVSSAPNVAHFSRLRALPLTINAPDPRMDQLFGSAYNLQTLKAMANALRLPEQFRPESMARGVRSKERGYWSIPIDILSSEKAQATGPKTYGQQQKHQGSKRRPLLKHQQLTEEEFLAVWEDLNKFVSSGNAGWGVRVVRRSFSVTYSLDQFDRGAAFYLHVYCFGEAIPYIYAMLLVCTRLYVLCRPIQWISAVQEIPVLAMTGDEVRKGDLGSWIRYRDAGGRTCWGVSDSVDK